MALKPAYIYAGLVVWLAVPLLSRRKASGRPSLPIDPPGDAQVPVAPPPRDEFDVRKFPAHVLSDQAVICSSPLRLRAHDLGWLLPLATAAGASLAFDKRIMRDVVPTQRTFNNLCCDISDALAFLLLAAPVFLFAVGNLRDNERAREAGFVAGEAIIDAYLFDQALKLITWRERPNHAEDSGRFFDPHAGLNSSFLSSHSMLCWTSASVLALEYPAPQIQLAVYTAAAIVSLTRVLGQRHFPTDVLLGGTVGWFLGHFVFRSRHGLAPRP